MSQTKQVTSLNESNKADQEIDPVLAQLVKVVGPDNASNDELERIVYSGDPSSLPHFHYRWKRKYLADYVVRVEKTDQIREIILIAKEHKLAIVPRGGGSSCMGSSCPSRGGISLDIKRMNKIIDINAEEGFVRVEPGVTFADLEIELAKKGMELGIYPTSAKSAVIGGWIACGGRAGIGTPRYGTLEENIIELKVVLSNGEIKIVAGKEALPYIGSFGILGVIAEAKLKIRKKPPRIKPLSYTFQRLESLCDAFTKVVGLSAKPVYLKIADARFQKYSNPLEKGRYVLTLAYNDGDDIPFDELQRIVGENGGGMLDDEYAENEWELRYDCEFKPKEYCHTLMFQEVWIHSDNVYDVLEAYERSKKTHKVPALWFGMLGTQSMVRLELMAMLNPDRYLEFISSKGILHKMVKRSIRLGGGPYTIGLQNSIYMKKAYPERYAAMKKLKNELDVEGIMNPDRVTNCLTSYSRINLLFFLASGFRRLAKYVAR